jgi:hypothetical protein
VQRVCITLPEDDVRLTRPRPSHESTSKTKAKKTRVLILQIFLETHVDSSPICAPPGLSGHVRPSEHAKVSVV